MNAGCAALQKLNFPCRRGLFESIQLSPHACRKRWNCFPKSLKALCIKGTRPLCGGGNEKPSTATCLCTLGETGSSGNVHACACLFVPLSLQPGLLSIQLSLWMHSLHREKLAYLFLGKEGGRGHLPPTFEKGMNKRRGGRSLLHQRGRAWDLSGMESAGRYICPLPALWQVQDWHLSEVMKLNAAGFKEEPPNFMINNNICKCA